MAAKLHSTPYAEKPFFEDVLFSSDSSIDTPDESCDSRDCTTPIPDSAAPTNLYLRFGVLTRDADPQPGSTYLLVDPAKAVAIALEAGELRLLPTDTLREGGKWLCTEQSGWLGFQNSVSGTFLGLTHPLWGPKKPEAKAKGQEDCQSFQVRKYPVRGYRVMVPLAKERAVLWTVENGGDVPVATAKSAETAWEFIKVSA
jgi:hypothetical protein